MAVRELSAEEMEALVGTRHGVTGMEYPPQGLQPYYQWLVRTLHLLAESSAGALRVARDASSPTAVTISPGRASIQDAALSYEGGVIDLAEHNNDTVYVWLFDDGGAAAVGFGAEGDGWPAQAHIKLAQVTLEAGAITGILDRRFETVFRV
ncbi:MAG TPA: hypothetical protein VF184_08365 [Phycisphaeraceae bacterium]